MSLHHNSNYELSLHAELEVVPADHHQVVAGGVLGAVEQVPVLLSHQVRAGGREQLGPPRPLSVRQGDELQPVTECRHEDAAQQPEDQDG